MGKQLNFYLDKSDWQIISAYLAKKGFVMISDRSETEKPVIFPNTEVEGNNFFRCLVLAKQLDCVMLSYANAYKSFAVDIVQSPVIELDMGFSDGEQIYRGRLFYDTVFQNKNKEWEYKNEEFLRATRNLFAWFKRTFVRSFGKKSFILYE